MSLGSTHLNLEEASKESGYSVSQLSRFIRAGKLPAKMIMLGPVRKYFVKITDLAQIVANRKTL